MQQIYEKKEEFNELSQKIAEAIEAVTKIDVTIMDSNRNRIAATGKYQEPSFGNIGEKSAFSVCLQTREVCIIEETGKSEICMECSSLNDSLAEKVGRDQDGTGLGINSSDHSGDLTNNIGLLSYEDRELVLKMNIRSPITVDPDELAKKLSRQAVNMHMACSILNYNPHFYMPVDHPLIQMLSEVYREITGDTESRPKTIGSGSYARILKDFVPFGPSFQGEELCFHKQDEFISSERLLLLSKIYAEALYRMASF